jgi:taurine dioxygenase
MSPAPHATVTALSGALGVRVDGVDVARDASAPLVDALRKILDEHLVIHLPHQGDLTPEDLLAFAARWGELAIHPSLPSIDGHPGIVEIADPTELTTVWHQDVTHLERPPSVSILVAREVPSVGGDTLWANQYAAYELLSPGLRETVAGLYAVHEGVVRVDDAPGDERTATAIHPVVATHLRTRRKALFVNASYTTRLDGWTADESEPLLALLYRAAVRDELTCRHRWTAGDMVIWDNRATQHCTVGDTAPAEPRRLHRVAVVGDIPH